LIAFYTSIAEKQQYDYRQGDLFLKTLKESRTYFRLLSILSLLNIGLLVSGQLPSNLFTKLAYVVLICFVPSIILIYSLFSRISLIETLIIGMGLALVLCSFGALLSYVTGNFWIRLLPVATASLSVFLIKREESGFEEHSKINRNLLILAASALGTLALIEQLRTTLGSQPLYWDGSWLFYVDLPFQIALTAEVLERAPSVMPFLPTKPINYTWMFHGGMGVIGSVGGFSAQVMVLKIWPILFSGIISAFFAILAFVMTRNKWVTVISPLALATYGGILFFEGGFQSVYPISPTQEFGTITLITLIIVFIYIQNHYFINGKYKVTHIATLSIVGLIATASKGSNGILILSFSLTYILIKVATRTRALRALVPAVFLSISTLIAIVAVISSQGGLEFNWARFSALTLQQLLELIAVGLTFALSAKFFIMSKPLELETKISLIAMVGLGIIASAVFSHPGGSQGYFFRSIVPFLVVFLTYSCVRLFEVFGKRRAFLVLVPMIILGLWVKSLDYQRLTVLDEVYAFGWVVLVLIIGLTLVYLVRFIFLQANLVSERNWLVMFAFFAILSIQVFSILDNSYSRKIESGWFTDKQRDAYSFLKAESNPQDLLITNQFCLNNVQFDDPKCDERTFSVSAYTGRRVYFETTSYAMSDPIFSDYQRQARVKDFLESPTKSEYEFMLQEGVDWIYLNLKVGSNSELSDYAELEFENSDSQVWKLKTSP
jgi:hypothetical protein